MHRGRRFVLLVVGWILARIIGLGGGDDRVRGRWIDFGARRLHEESLGLRLTPIARCRRNRRGRILMDSKDCVNYLTQRMGRDSPNTREFI